MRFSDFRQYKAPADCNVFVFICEDDLLLEESRSVWREAFGGEWDFEKLGVKEFEEIPPAKLMDDALTPSLFSRSRAILVTNSEKLTKGRQEVLGEIQKVTQSSLKVIAVSATPKGMDWAKGFPVIEIDSVKPADAARWLIDRYKLSSDVARYVVQNLGADLRQLHTEIEKLQTYVGGQRAVGIQDVDILILRSEQFGPYELDDAIQMKDYRRAVQVLGAMLEDGGEPLLILSRIVRVWRQLFIGRGMAAKRNPREAAAAAGAPAWKANEFVAACKRHEWKRLAAGFRELLEADRAFKTSVDPKVYFDVLLWKLIG